MSIGGKSDGDAEQAADGHHYEHPSQVPSHVKKYWYQRHKIFSKYDDGIWLTDDAWFEVTPEPIANKIAEHVSKAAPLSKTVLIDTFGGVGTNAIAFAISGRWDRVFAIEQNPQKIKCAKHNAEIYGVAGKIWWIQGDCFEMLKKRFSKMGNEVVIFGSPPWGGPGYKDDAIFNLETMQPYGLEQLCTGFEKITRDMVLYLPRTSNLNQIAKYVPEGEKVQATHYCIDGASKALCVFFGNMEKIEMRA